MSWDVLSWDVSANSFILKAVHGSPGPPCTVKSCRELLVRKCEYIYYKIPLISPKMSLVAYFSKMKIDNLLVASLPSDMSLLMNNITR